MAKGAYLRGYKEKIKGWVTGYYLKDRTILAKEVLSKVNERLSKEANREVSLSYIQAELAELHRKDKEGKLDFPIDKPWSIGACSNPEYASYFPPDSIPAIIEFADTPAPITLRQALWLVRLRYIVEKIYPEKAQGYNQVAALVYAQAHYVSDACGNDIFDSSELDEILVSGKFDDLLKIHVDNIFWREDK